MATYRFYTVTIDGKEYGTDAPCYRWADVERYFGLPRAQIRRGSVAGGPTLTAEILEQAQATNAKGNAE